MAILKGFPARNLLCIGASTSESARLNELYDKRKAAGQTCPLPELKITWQEVDRTGSKNPEIK